MTHDVHVRESSSFS